MNGEVLIVDEHTGRILAGRRYNEGIHQAIEAKEGVEVKAENQTLATVTLQNYFRLYKKLAGMTGTAETEAAEFMSTYKLGVVPIPTNKPMIRLDQSDLIYKNEEIKFNMVVEDIAQRYEKGQPVLVGTTSVEKSEYLSKLLAKKGVRHEVLNAKNHAREAIIVAQAGRLGAVTVATNMAGRGTDVMLGGNAEFLTVDALSKRGLDPEENPEAYEAAWAEEFAKVKETVAEEAEKVIAVGGLYVLGTERHESRRIDNQLRGRSGRQGDKGESRFYLSLTDDLMRLFNSGAASSLMNRASVPDDTAIESKIVSRAIQSAQTQVEGRNAEIRKNVLKYDDVLNRQREAIYGDRRHILEGDDIAMRIDIFLADAISAIVSSRVSDATGIDWDLDALWADLKAIYPVGLEISEVLAEAGNRSKLTKNWLTQELISDAKLAYEKRSNQIGDAAMRELERRVVLSVVDRKWREHLYEMDYLKEGIGLRAMAQRDPLVEYQREGFGMFQEMMASIKEEVVKYMFNVEVEVTATPTIDPSKLTYTAPNEDGAPEARTANETRANQDRSGKQGAQASGQQQAKPADGKGSSFFKS
jgi:preprotein translocase subunit SecA